MIGTDERARLRRLALRAQEDRAVPRCAACMTPGELALAQALTPKTVLRLLEHLDELEQPRPAAPAALEPASWR